MLSCLFKGSSRLCPLLKNSHTHLKMFCPPTVLVFFDALQRDGFVFQVKFFSCFTLTQIDPLLVCQKQRKVEIVQLWQHKPRQLRYSKQFIKQKSGVHSVVCTLVIMGYRVFAFVQGLALFCVSLFCNSCLCRLLAYRPLNGVFYINGAFGSRSTTCQYRPLPEHQ